MSDRTGAGAGRRAEPADPVAGLRRARAATLLMLALPGSAYLYQGEELGLPEVLDLPDEARRDPAFHRGDGQDGYRDGCRVPLPWSGEKPPYGFGPGASWLPQPPEWAGLSVAAQEGVPGSTLELYRRALALRRGLTGELTWLDSPPGVLAFRRGDLECVVNLSGSTVLVGGGVLLASGEIDGTSLPSDTTLPADTTLPSQTRLPSDTTIWRSIR
jgi:alpha-glucosidase